MASESDHFDLQKLYDQLYGCITDDGTILMDNYVNVYDEISKLFKLFGTVFGFVNSDVTEKVGILREYRKSVEADKYATVQRMVEHEVETKTTNNKKHASGSRTLLRLHRALEFIIDFMRELKDVEEHTKLSGLGSKSYDRTLAKHHPWIVRKGVGIAMYTLPTQGQLMEKMKVEDRKHTQELLGQVAEKGDTVFKTIENLYTSYDLHSLP